MTTITPDTPALLAEAALRSAISRAYYAAFWQARSLLEAEGVRIPSLDAHPIIIDTFRNSPNRARMAIGVLPGRLHRIPLHNVGPMNVRRPV